MKTWRVLFVIAVSLAVLSGALTPENPSMDERRVILELFPEAGNLQKSGTPPHYRLGNDLVAFNTKDIVHGIRGYAGPIYLLVVLGRDGRIRAVRVIEHRETKNYVHYLFSEEFLSTFVGKSILEPFVVGRDVDAVSRATVSEKALCRTIRDSSRRVAREVFKLDVKTDQEGQSIPPGPFVLVGWFGLCLAYYLLSRRKKRLLRFRNILLLGSVVVMGVYLSEFFSVIHLLQLAKGEFSLSWQFLGVVGLIGGSFLVFGRFYCGYLCPFGAISELTGQKLPQWSVSDRLDSSLRRLKYWVLLSVILVSALRLRPSEIDFEPYLTVFSLRGNLFTWGIVVVSLLAGLRLSRPWCRYLCPVGALSGLLDREDRTYRGLKTCPVGLEKYRHGECIRCNRCRKG